MCFTSAQQRHTSYITPHSSDCTKPLAVPSADRSPDASAKRLGVTFSDARVHNRARSAADRAEGKYFSIVLALGGRVSSENSSIQRADPTTIGKTVMKPRKR